MKVVLACLPVAVLALAACSSGGGSGTGGAAGNVGANTSEGQKLTQTPWCDRYTEDGKPVVEKMTFNKDGTAVSEQYEDKGDGTPGALKQTMKGTWTIKGQTLTLAAPGEGSSTLTIEFGDSNGTPVLKITAFNGEKNEKPAVKTACGATAKNPADSATPTTKGENVNPPFGVPKAPTKGAPEDTGSSSDDNTQKLTKNAWCVAWQDSDDNTKFDRIVFGEDNNETRETYLPNQDGGLGKRVKTAKGIWSVKGDELTLALGDGKPHTTKFSIGESNGNSVLLLQLENNQFLYGITCE